MKKLLFEALQQKATQTNQQELLSSVSGGTFGDCHCSAPIDYEASQGNIAGAFWRIGHEFFCDAH